MRRIMMAGAGALAMLGLAGCSDTNSWFSSSPNATTGATASGSTVTAPPGTSGSTMDGTGVGGMGADTSGTSMIPPTTGNQTTGNQAIQLNRRGGGASGNSAERDRAFYPGTLGGNGLWQNETDAPGGN